MHKLEDIREMKNQFVDAAKFEISKGVEQVCTEEMSQVVDMIKDLCYAEEKIIKACYYEQVMKAMSEAGENERYGYDHYRYSNGHFAPKGHGHYGYTENMENNANGYSPVSHIGSHNLMHNRMGYVMPMVDREAGMNYEMWKDARRHYQESKSPRDKDLMNEHARKHLDETLMTLKEIMNASDPELQKRMKNDLNNFLTDMV